MPVENLSHYERERRWVNREYDDYPVLQDAAREAWRAVCASTPKRSKASAPCRGSMSAQINWEP
jgi:hypothetical protein